MVGIPDELSWFLGGCSLVEMLVLLGAAFSTSINPSWYLYYAFKHFWVYGVLIVFVLGEISFWLDAKVMPKYISNNDKLEFILGQKIKGLANGLTIVSCAILIQFLIQAGIQLAYFVGGVLLVMLIGYVWLKLNGLKYNAKNV